MLTKGCCLAFCLTLSFAFGQSVAGAEAPRWGYYEDIGPDHWGDLSEEFATCKSGKAQSPINIGRQVVGRLPPLQFRYRASPINVINNGRSIIIEVPPGNRLTIAGKDYELKQFHFRTPSEHARSAYRLPMEIQFVHESQDGELAVLAVLARTTYRPNPILNRIWEHIPRQPGEMAAPARLRINPISLLPVKRDYATYQGSLTTPPCTEGVRWIVFQEPVRVSRDQVDKLARGIGDNARPLQPLNGRTVKANR
jgi:carbonic anhydrase